MYGFFMNFIMGTFVPRSALSQQQVTFYRMRELHSNGEAIGYSEVEEHTACLGMCYYRVNCTSFNAYVDNNMRNCDFLTNIQCGFVEPKTGRSIFVQEKICKFQLFVGNKCAVERKNNDLRLTEASVSLYGISPPQNICA